MLHLTTQRYDIVLVIRSNVPFPLKENHKNLFCILYATKRWRKQCALTKNNTQTSVSIKHSLLSSIVHTAFQSSLNTVDTSATKTSYMRLK